MNAEADAPRRKPIAVRVPDAGETEERGRRDLRRFLRFNLLTALILFLLVSAYFGVRQRYVVTAEAAAAKKVLTEHGATVVERPAAPVWLREALLMHGPSFQHVEEVSFSGDGTIWLGIFVSQKGSEEAGGRKDLEALTKLPHLRSIDLTGRIPDDETLAYLARCGSLEEIRWSLAAVNDAGIARLTTLKELRSITLAGTLTTDRSLEILAELPAIETIALDDSTTGRGIAALARYPRLRRVDATATALGAEDVRSLIDRGIEVALSADAPTRPADPDAPVVAYVYGDAGEKDEPSVNPLRLAFDPGGELDERSRERFAAKGAGLELQFLGDRRPSNELIVRLASDPRIVSVELPACGAPYRFEELRELLAARPAEAPRCRIHGHVLIRGETLVRETILSNSSTSYIPCDVSPEDLRWLQAAGVIFIGDRATRIPIYCYPEAGFPEPVPVDPPSEPDA